MAITIRMNPEEENLVRSYAKLHAVSVSEAMKRALIEKIEDEYDIAAAEEAYQEYLKNPITYTHKQVKELLGL